MWLKITIAFVLVWSCAQACQLDQSCEIDLTDPSVQILMTGINNLTDGLLQLLYTNKNLQGNIVFSPISIYLALIAYLFGAKDDTYDQLATVLTLNGVQWDQIDNGLNGILNGLEILKTANFCGNYYSVEHAHFALGVFLDTKFKFTKNYKDAINRLNWKYFSINFKDFSYVAAAKISEFINSQTGFGNPVIFPVAPDQSLLVYVAATAYFASSWAPHVFDYSNRVIDTFNALEGPKSVVFMRTTESFNLYSDHSFTAVQLPYAGDFALLVVLPGNKQPLSTAEIGQITKRMRQATVNLQIPVLAFAFNADLTKLLATLNLTKLSMGADLSNMADKASDLGATPVHHGAVFGMDETGTLISMNTGQRTKDAQQLNFQNDTPFVNVNRPFYAFVQHIDSGIIIQSAFVRHFPLQ